MTLKDFLKRVDSNDLDKMLIWSDGEGWSNIKIVKNENDITIYPDFSSPFSGEGCIDPRNIRVEGCEDKKCPYFLKMRDGDTCTHPKKNFWITKKEYQNFPEDCPLECPLV